MAKVGQVYKMLDGPFMGGTIFAITNEGAIRYHTITNNGTVEYVSRDFIDCGGDCILLAEYPTWQQAVNSPEFNGR